MEGKRVIVTMMVLIMLVQGVVQAQNQPPLDPSIPPLDPFQPVIPGPPLDPNPPQMACPDKCPTTCAKAIIPILYNICNKGCNLKCKLIGSEYIYNCTNSCAQSMPTSLHSDKEKMESYVNACFNKCSKNNN